MHQLRTHHQHKEGRIFAWMALMIALAVGLLRPIFPNFVKLFVGTEQAVSIFYAAMAAMMLLSALGSTVILHKIPRTKVTKLALIISGIVFLLFIFVTRIHTLAILETFRIWLEMMLLVALGLFVRDFARKRNLGREEGLHYRFQNIGTFIGPLVGGFIAIKFGYEFVFIAASLVTFYAFIYFYHKHVVQKHPAIIDDHTKTRKILFSNVKKFFSNAGRLKAYFVTLCFMLWLGFKRLYVPLYVASVGYLESMSGLIIALSILPLILLEVKVGFFADKHGLKKPITLGFLIMGTLLLAVFFSPFILLNFLLLPLVNLGGSLIEPLQETLLFKHLNKEEEDELYGVYMTADPIAFFLAPALGGILLIFLPFKFLFLFLGLIMLTVSLISWRTRTVP